MSAFVTGIQIQDHVSSVLYDIGGALSFAVSAMVSFQDAIQANLDALSIEKVGIQAESATVALDELNAASQTIVAPEIMQQPLGGIQAECSGSGSQTDSDDPIGMHTESLTEFESMSAMVSHMKTELQKAAAGAFSPVVQSLNEIANNQAFQSMVNTALQGLWTLANSEALQVFIARVNQLVDTLNGSGIFQAFVNGAVIAFQGIISIASVVVGLLGNMAGFIAENWAIIAPIVYGVVAALALYYSKMIMVKIATALFTVAQWICNAVMSMNPFMLIVIGLILLISIIYSVCSAIAKVTGAAGSGFGIILGCIFLVNAAFFNLGMLVANIALGIGNAISALCKNMMTAFHNAVVSVKSWFYSLLSTALFTVAGICEALNKLPFVSFDYSGIESAANDYAVKAEEEQAKKEEYTSVTDAFQEGFHTFDAFRDGWASDAFNAGAAEGDALSNKISGVFKGLSEDKGDLTKKYQNSVGDYSGNMGSGIGNVGTNMDSSAAQTAVNTGQTAENTAVMADALDITNEQLKYLRDIAERDTVNRFTTASIKVEMTNQNHINSEMDIDGVVNGLAVAVSDAMSQAAEGVHI